MAILRCIGVRMGRLMPFIGMIPSARWNHLTKGTRDCLSALLFSKQFHDYCVGGLREFRFTEELMVIVFAKKKVGNQGRGHIGTEKG